RPDVLDPALLRPGRFDRQVVVDLPDIRGREAILKVHMRKVPISADVDPSVIARGTPGFSGADLANLINEAALFAARYSDKKIDQNHLDLAKDKIMMGAERKSMILSEEQKRITAYHEAGHAIVGRLSPKHDPVYKVTIIPRGRALGVTMFLPEEDTYMQSKEYLLSRICALFGGRIAENIINGDNGITTGASNDIEVATNIATNMVTKWGLSEKLGPLKYGEDEGSPFLGRSASSPTQTISEDTSKLIDQEIKSIINSCYSRADEMLKSNLDKLNVMADALLKYETIDANQIDDIMAGAEPREPKGWSDDEPTKKVNKKTSIKGTAEEL
ncbi:MAG: cell division protein FtsH, partial [SAR86 cluster bacterium]|nr:cell division protein FtsH [SAR86 cluster bacterium]